MRSYIIALFLCLPLVLHCAVREVAIDGTKPYTSIRAAVNDAVIGDIVLVHPGRYVENVNVYEKNGILICSLEYLTGDTTYVRTTIIDGSSNANSTICFTRSNQNCTIRGFTITGGSGYILNSITNPDDFYGGGLFINAGCSVSLISNIITGNKASYGGGMAIIANAIVTMSNTAIYSNVAQASGGGIHLGGTTLGQPNITFDSTNRCNIYNNFAQWGLDMHWQGCRGGRVSVYLNKFTVRTWSKYYADFQDTTVVSNSTSPYTVFSVNEGYVDPIDADLYVSPQGNDTNDGTTSSSALKTPAVAMQRINSSSENRRTVHLLAGEHRNLLMGVYLPISVKDYTTLKGESTSQTKIYAANMVDGAGAIAFGIECTGMIIQDFSISTSNAKAIIARSLFSSAVQNIVIENASVNKSLVLMGSSSSIFDMRNVTMRNNTASLYGYGLNLTGSKMKLENIIVKDSRTLSLHTGVVNRGYGGFAISVKDSLRVTNSLFINNTHFTSDSLANYRVYPTSGAFSANCLFENCLFASNRAKENSRTIEFSNNMQTDLINCTFANNYGSNRSFLLLDSSPNRIINCLFANNADSCEIKCENNTVINNCLFLRSDAIWETTSGAMIIWGENNLVGTFPQFVGGDSTSVSYYCLRDDEVLGHSPAINAGTMHYSLLPTGYVFPVFDGLGNPRIHGGSIDIGFVESPGYTSNSDMISSPYVESDIYNYPNPFNPSTTIKFNLSRSGNVEIAIYNVKGQQIKSLSHGYQKEGTHQMVWDGKDQHGSKVSSGVYFLRLKLSEKTITKKMLMMK